MNDNDQRNELERMAQEMDEEDRRFFELFKNFTETPQWKALDDFAAKYIRKMEVDIVYGDEPHHIRNIKRGICKGMVLLLDLPDLLFEQGKLTIESIEEDENDDEQD